MIFSTRATGSVRSSSVFDHHCRPTVRLSALALSLVALIAGIHPASAATNGSVSQTGVTARPTCATSLINVTFSFTATVADGLAPFPADDMVAVVYFDGNGNPLRGIDVGQVPGSVGGGGVGLPLTGITARPVTVKLID